jgi:hypothetical protein
LIECGAGGEASTDTPLRYAGDSHGPATAWNSSFLSHNSAPLRLREPGEVLGGQYGDHIKDFVHAGNRYCLFLRLKCDAKPISLANDSFHVRAARELTLEAAQSAGSGKGLLMNPSSRSLNSAQIKKMLDSRNEREVLDGMRKVISVWTPCVYTLAR